MYDLDLEITDNVDHAGALLGLRGWREVGVAACDQYAMQLYNGGVGLQSCVLSSK